MDGCVSCKLMPSSAQDRERDRQRYEVAGGRVPNHPDLMASELLPLEYRPAVVEFERVVKNYVSSESRVIELGCGTGRHTSALVKSSRFVVGIDYALSALLALQSCGAWGPQVHLAQADIAAVPMPDSSFSVVVCTSSLSYADPVQLIGEIRRLLSSDGTLIVIDALRHNPIYKLNRFVALFRGDRTFTSLRRIPSLKTIASLTKYFGNSEVHFFGHSLFIMPLLKIFCSLERSLQISMKLDRRLPRWMAFRFVLVATELEKVNN